MTELQVTIHRMGTVNDALTGKEGDGLVCSFGEFKNTPLIWKSFRQLIGLKCAKSPAAGVPTGNGAAVKS